MKQENTFCFIFCSNDPIFQEESLKYIRRLEIPEGYYVDILSVVDASSMAAGYNEALSASNAKYKIYLHQDVFIVNTNFLKDLLDIFCYPQIGMIGMVGVLSMPMHGVMWYSDRIGKLYTNTILESKVWAEKEFKEAFKEVEAIDGLLMATQYDIQWREDLFCGWDFYDVSQCMEFRKRDYKIVVPQQDKPWCIHDEGMNNLKNYYQERKKFIKEYRSMLTEINES